MRRWLVATSWCTSSGSRVISRGLKGCSHEDSCFVAGVVVPFCFEQETSTHSNETRATTRVMAPDLRQLFLTRQGELLLAGLWARFLSGPDIKTRSVAMSSA